MKKIVAGLVAFCSLTLYSPVAVFATSICDSGAPGCTCTGPNKDVPSIGCATPIVVNLISLFIEVLGGIALLFLLYGAIRFVTSRGDPKAIEGAQKTMTYAIIGVILVLASFIIVNIATKALGLPSMLDNFTIFQGTIGA